MSNNVKPGHKEKQSYGNKRTTGKEQYYTTPEAVKICLDEVRRHIDLDGRIILEPCGGTGEFIEGFRRIGIKDKNILSYDIDPKHELVCKANYLEVEFRRTDLISITNPPYGRASSLAKKFFQHASDHCEYICYLVPKSWRKWSVQNSLDNNFHLISDIEMPKNCFYRPDSEGESKKDVLNTVFQIWKKDNRQRRKIKIPDNGLVQKIKPTTKEVQVKRGDTISIQKRPDKVTGANFEIIVFGHSCGKCREIDPLMEYEAKTTTMYLNIDRQDVKEAIKSIDFSKHFNNVAYVQALSLQEINYELNQHFNLKNFDLEEI
jgi:predicted RNA methylase/DNA-dependent RNA polymerase auxiliary subunit epsilon